ncbi:MAG: Com family DNA-binding transcriptional regulator [Rubrivivax sp.]|nr:Com family DNA-binding transcriptional regulator [Rubrivivax sp.]
MRQELKEIRCGQCERKLGEGLFTRLRIKCQRCKTLNDLSASAADHSSPSTTPARHRASSEDGTKDDDKTGAAKAL